MSSQEWSQSIRVKVMNSINEILTNNTNDMVKVETYKMSLVKQLEEIQKLDGQIAELGDEEAIEKEIFDR